ncbi:uncharacterized protein LOC129580194 [Sitodiplosis mosellana]|uniref:uncharacterized protein LOC129580194 n=1 Tax=Sitodiplosis mosellana TaxID=263140 RepID=UPI00244401F0|nr:uncharacterized protein LOC129580194 [Sitodiplosis mosellana]
MNFSRLRKSFTAESPSWCAKLKFWDHTHWVAARPMAIHNGLTTITMEEHSWTVYTAQPITNVAVGRYSNENNQSGTVYGIVRIEESIVTIKPVHADIVNGVIDPSGWSPEVKDCALIVAYSPDGNFAVRVMDYTMPEYPDEDCWRFRIGVVPEPPNLWTGKENRGRFKRLRRAEMMEQMRNLDARPSTSRAGETVAEDQERQPSIEPSRAVEAIVVDESNQVVEPEAAPLSAGEYHPNVRRVTTAETGTEWIEPSEEGRHEFQPLFDRPADSDEETHNDEPGQARSLFGNVGSRRGTQTEPEPPIDLVHRWDKSRLD